MADADTSGVKRPAGAPKGAEAGLGVHSSVPHALHPTAQKILAAARKILVERGYQGLTLQAIAAEAQVNKAGVWYYFGGKQQLVLAVLEDVFVRESLHFGTMPPADATLATRVDLIIGSARQVRDRVRRFRAFYELLPEAARDAELRAHLMGLLPDLVRVGQAVLAPAVAQADGDTPRDATLGQFASILLDGIIVQMIVAAPEFDLEAALAHARRSLLLVAESPL